MFDRDVYIQRREKLKSDVGSGIILLLGNTESSMNYKDNLYPFRQDSSFLYFFGIDRPNLAGLIDIDNDREIIFGDHFTSEMMMWTGYQEPIDILSEKSGIRTVKTYKYLSTCIDAALVTKTKIHYLLPYRPSQFALLGSLLRMSSEEVSINTSLVLIKAIIKLRSYKSSLEIAEITRAVNTTVSMQLQAMKMGHKGRKESELAGMLQAIAIADGGNLSFPTILTQQGHFLHISYSDRMLKEGNLVLCDCGAETAMHYAGDLTRTFPVNKKFTTVQRDIYEIVIRAHESAIRLLRPGVPFRDIHLHACEKLTEGLQELNIMKGDVTDAVNSGAHALFFPCGLGHMIGLDTHDMENLGEDHIGYDDVYKRSSLFGLKSLRLARPLEEDFVVTVEPGLYFNPMLIEEWRSKKMHTSFINYDNLDAFVDLGGIRIEDNFVVTETGSRKLGDDLPQTPTEIELFRENSMYS